MANFRKIPDTLRTPFIYVETDPTGAGSGAQGDGGILVLAQKRSAGTAPANVPVEVFSAAQGVQLGGAGSQAAEMIAAIRAINTSTRVYLVPLADDGSATAAVWEMTVTASGALAGTLHLMIAGYYLPIAVAAAATATAIATAIAAAITAAAAYLPVTATSTGAVVTITARNGGTVANGFVFLANYGARQAYPVGVSVATAQVTPGATDPSLTAALASLGDDRYDLILHPYTDATSMAALIALLNDDSGRWSWQQMLYGHAWTAKRATISDLGTYASSYNDPHNTTIGLNPASPTSPHVMLGDVGGAAALSLGRDPGAPMHGTITLRSTLPAPRASRWTQAERDALLHDGVATLVEVGTGVQIERLISMYRLDEFGSEDDAYLDVTTPYTLAWIAREVRGDLQTALAGYKVAEDGTTIGTGKKVTTPQLVKGLLISTYRRLERESIVENADAFIEALQVVRNGPTRVDVVPFQPDLINPLMNIGLLLRWRLQYQNEA